MKILQWNAQNKEDKNGSDHHYLTLIGYIQFLRR